MASILYTTPMIDRLNSHFDSVAALYEILIALPSQMATCKPKAIDGFLDRSIKPYLHAGLVSKIDSIKFELARHLISTGGSAQALLNLS